MGTSLGEQKTEAQESAAGKDVSTTWVVSAGSAEIKHLVERCRNGERSAWAQLVRLYGPVIWTVARSFDLCASDCEDICQFTWQRLVEHLPRLHQLHRIGAWLVTVAKREAIKYSRVSGRTIPVPDAAEIALQKVTALADPEVVALSSLRDSQVLAAFRQLPERHQAMLGMMLADPPPSYDAIAAALDIPRGSIGPSRMRALNQLRGLLADGIE